MNNKKSSTSSLWRTEFSMILQPSKIDGIGVFTLQDIPQGAILFDCSHVIRKLNTKDVPSALLKYCAHLNDTECLGPERFDRMEIGWFLNHSDTPNIGYNNPALATGDRTREMYALRDINAGEELLLNYNELNEPEYLKEDYYK